MKEFVRLHRGDVNVGDAPAGGASFTVRIPLTAPKDVDVEPTAELDEEMARHAADELRTYVGDRVTRSSHPDDAPLDLVVEDNREMNAFLADAFSRDYRVVTAFDGREGLERALAVRPDLIVTDVMMPEMTGEDLVREVRRHEEMNDTRILVVTAKADDDMRVQLLRGGAQDSLAKPFATEELLARAGALVAQKQRTDYVLRASYEELRAAKEVAEEASRAKDHLLAVVSHELRTPLTPVLMATSVLAGQSTLLSPEAAKAVDVIQRNVEREARLIDDLLDLTRLTRGSESPSGGGGRPCLPSDRPRDLPERHRREGTGLVSEPPGKAARHLGRPAATAAGLLERVATGSSSRRQAGGSTFAQATTRPAVCACLSGTRALASSPRRCRTFFTCSSRARGRSHASTVG